MEISVPSRRERERLIRRTAILDAARAVFAEKGYAEATVDEIAERAEFGKGTIYNYFEGGKEGLLFAVLDEMYDAWAALIRDHFAEADAVADTREAFRGLIARTIAHFLDHRELFLILVKEVHRIVFAEEPAKAAYLARQRERIVEAIVPPLEAAMAAGRLRSIPPHGVAHVLIGNLNGYLLFACQHGVGACGAASGWHAPAQASDYITTILFDGLLPRD